MEGKTISQYKVIEMLGEGGMGVVYTAYDTKLHRKVALKFLFPRATSSETENRRFVREARAAASINHPNICSVYEINEYDGTPFIAMEYVDGISLDKIIESGPMGIEDIIDIASQIGDGLEEAHERGIIHRDIKPANIMIDKKGRVKILDFGLARASDSTILTRENITLGTVSYMSPEQSRGLSVDSRTDIWALGIMIYEMITGIRPFFAEFDQAIIYAINNSEFKPLSDIRTGIPEWIETVVSGCLKKDPEERYDSAAAISHDLRNGQGFTKVPSSHSVNIRKYLFTGFIVITLILIGTVTFKMLPFLKPSSNIDRIELISSKIKIAVLPLENTGNTEDEYMANGITEELTDRLTAIDGLVVISRKSAMYYQDSGKPVHVIGKELGVQYVIDGKIRFEGEDEKYVSISPRLIRVSDDNLIWTKEYRGEFNTLFDVQSKIAEEVTEQLEISVSEAERKIVQVRHTDNEIAHRLYIEGNDCISFAHLPENNFRRAIVLFEQALDYDSLFVLAWAKLSLAHLGMNFFGYDKTPQRLEMARIAIDRALLIEPGHPEAHRVLGYYYYRGLKDYGKALDEFKFVVRHMPNDASTLADIASIWRRNGNLEDALTNFQIAFSLNPKDAKLAAELSNTYSSMRRVEDAVLYADSSISMDPDYHWAYLSKIIGQIQGGDIKAALNTLDSCPDRKSDDMIWARCTIDRLDRNYDAALVYLDGISKSAIRVQNLYIPVSMLKAIFYKLNGDSEMAVESYQNALDNLELALKENPEDSRVLSSLGIVHAGLGNKEKALYYGRRSVEISPSSKDYISGSERLVDLAHIHTIVGSKSRAVKLLDEVLNLPCWHTMESIDKDPCFDSIKDLSEYYELQRKHGRKDI